MVRGEIFRLPSPRGARGREQQGARYAIIVQADEFATLSTALAPQPRQAPVPPRSGPRSSWTARKRGSSSSRPPSWIHSGLGVPPAASMPTSFEPWTMPFPWSWASDYQPIQVMKLEDQNEAVIRRFYGELWNRCGLRLQTRSCQVGCTSEDRSGPLARVAAISSATWRTFGRPFQTGTTRSTKSSPLTISRDAHDLEWHSPRCLGDIEPTDAYVEYVGAAFFRLREGLTRRHGWSAILRSSGEHLASSHRDAPTKASRRYL